MRFSQPDLLAKALHALEDLGERAANQPVERTAEIRFLLAFLANYVEREHLVEFWRAIAVPLTGNPSRDFGRTQTVRNLAGFIRHSVEQASTTRE